MSDYALFAEQQAWRLTKTYNPYLIMLSVCISLLGAHTTTQLVAQSSSTGKLRMKLFWISLAAFMFGGCCTWSMHFVGMLALSTGVPFWFNVPLTITSAAFAISAAFIALGSGLLLEILHRRRFRYFLPLRATGSSSGDESTYEEESHMSRSSYSHSSESPGSSSTNAELEALLHGPEDHNVLDSLGDHWAKKYLVTRVLWTFWYSCTIEGVAKGFCLGLVFITMHYSGMFAMRFDGYIQWNYWIVFLSFLISWLTCQIAVIFMPSRINASRQLYFSATASFGACSLHWTGMWAATFYTYQPPPHNNNGAGDSVLPFVISIVVIASCILSYVLLIHAVSKSRQTFAEMIQTKREMWKIIAEKNAAEQSSRERTEFISIASHELRTPLYAISGFTELLEHSVLTDEQYAYVHAIKTASLTVKIITDNVLDFSRLENNSAEMKARPVLVDVRELVWTSVIGIALPNEDTELVLWVQGDVPQSAFLDDVYLTRILMNLLSNAIKFTSQGYITVKVSYQNGIVAFSVKDTGIGISKQLSEAIFEPFVQADTSLTRRHQGFHSQWTITDYRSGLGLSISRELVRRMGGEIHLDSEEGKGTEITIDFPMSLDDKAGSSRPRPPRSQSMAWSIPLRREGLPLLTNVTPITSLNLCLSNSQTFNLFRDMFASADITVLNESNFDPKRLVEMPQHPTFIDIRLFESIPTLFLNLLGATKPPCLVLFSEKNRGPFFTSVLEAENVILVRRPLAFHRLAQCFKEPWLYMGGHQRTVPSTPSYIMEDKSFDTIPFTTERNEVAAKASENMKTIRWKGSTEKMTGGERKKILMVEDNEVNGKMGVKLLSLAGYDPDLAEDGAVALNKIQQSPHKYCVILMDCQMPVMDGLECTRRIRELEREGKLPGHLPIIALTANAGAEQDCMEAGSDAFITKPLTGAALSRAIERVLNNTSDDTTDNTTVS